MNLKDLQYNVEIKPKNNIYAKFEFHKFCLAEEKDAWYLNSKVYRDKSGNSGDKVGKEFDVVVKIDLPHNKEIQIGYGHFWPDKFAKKVASNDDANWIFVQWRFKFSNYILMITNYKFVYFSNGGICYV